MTAESLSAKEVARELGTDARNFRKFMRATTPKEDQPGQGNRYAFDVDEVPELKAKFQEWTQPKPKKEKEPKPDPGPAAEELFDEELLFDEIGDEEEEEEPSDDELEEIEASEGAEAVEEFDLEEL